MSIIQAAGSGEVSTGFYKLLLDQSLKFNDDNNPFLTRTPSTSNQRTWTWSAWIKRGNLGSGQGIFGTDSNSTANFFLVQWTSNDTLFIQSLVSSSETIRLGTTRVFRDPSAWYHIVIAVDTTQATASNRLKLYVNGVQETDFSSGNATYPNSQNLDTLINNSSYPLLLGAVDVSGTPDTLDGYLAEINFIDGTALTPDSFGETKNGIWIPKSTSGLTFGTNGFHLTFKDDVVSEGFNTAIYEGNSTTQSISGLGFSPGLVWVKDRDNGNSHAWSDVVRGRGRNLISNATNAEVSAAAATDKDLISFDADGFSVGQFEDGTYNNNGSSMVAWCWEAGGAPTADNSAGAGATPTAGSVKIDGSNLGSALAGSIAATRLSANTTRGFSIGTFTKGSGNETVAHGLGAAPDWLLIKRRNGTGSWIVYHSANTANPETDYLRLNSSNGTADEATFWNDTAPTSTVFTVGAAFNSGEELVFYAWTDISGYSKFDTYSGSGSAGKAVTGLGFSPAWIMLKRTDTTGNWVIFDNTRSPQNTADEAVSADLSDREYTSADGVVGIDFDSDGFTLQDNHTTRNASGGTYIYMAFADTREAAFFKDVSSNGNHFTPVNLDYRDSVPDVPTNNFAVLNALDLASGFSLSEGNLQIATTTSGNRSSFGNFIPASGKWYFEANVTVISAIASWANFGVAPEASLPSTNPQSSSGGISFQDSGRLFVNGSSTDDWIADWAVGSILQCAFDVDTGKVWLGRNNTYGGSGDPASGSNEAGTISGKIKPLFGQSSGDNRSTTLVYNFGQDSSFSGNHATANSNADGNGHGSFAYAPPSGFLALCSQNLPDVDIIDGTDNFNTVLYTGNGYATTNTQSITGVGFQADFTWIKNRNGTGSHTLFDEVRGAGKSLRSDATDAESTQSDSLTSFDSDGFSLGDNSESGAHVNVNSSTYVSWNWLAGTAFSNDASATGVGTIDSEGQINTTAGFAILKWAGTGSNGTIAHGLNAAPELIIVKNRGETDEWPVLETVANGATHYLRLNANYTSTSTSVMWNNTAPTSSVFSIGTYEYVNASGENYISYIFHSVEGYSKVGSYTGNGNADGTYVHLGFRPALIILKRTDSAVGWMIIDNKRDPFNVADARLNPNSSGSEGTNVDFADYLSNGFKLRTSDSGFNASGGTYIYLAFADQPFKFSNAR